eukprot:4087617-Pyramimonas_sp.AAC.1
MASEVKRWKLKRNSEYPASSALAAVERRATGARCTRQVAAKGVGKYSGTETNLSAAPRRPTQRLQSRRPSLPGTAKRRRLSRSF